ncbi:hypothetical protein V1282_006478 [Nitrobacteraceae bacterium AZCC 2146]
MPADRQDIPIPIDPICPARWRYPFTELPRKRSQKPPPLKQPLDFCFGFHNDAENTNQRTTAYHFAFDTNRITTNEQRLLITPHSEN